MRIFSKCLNCGRYGGHLTGCPQTNINVEQGTSMTTLSPDELAACREAYCKEYGYDPEWDVVIDEDFQKAFSAGLFHKQAESAKEIADLKAIIHDYEISVPTATIHAQKQELLSLRERVAGLLKDAEIGAAVNRAARELPEGFDLHIELERHAGTVRLYLPDTDAEMSDFEHEDFGGQINMAIDAAIAQEKQND